MKSELKNMTRKQLEKLRGDIDKALAKLDEADKKAALIAAKKAAKAHGFDLSALVGATAAPAANKPKAKPADKRSKVAPKYRNPDNSSETWTGRGRKPKWVEAHLNAGGTLEQIAI